MVAPSDTKHYATTFRYVRLGVVSKSDTLHAVRALIPHNTLPKILVVSRCGDCFDLGLPGGHIQKGESPEKALVRELNEELGISRPEIIIPIFEGPNTLKARRFTRIYYVSRYSGVPYPKEKDKGNVVTWIPLSELVAPGRKHAWFNECLISSMRSAFPLWKF